MNPIKIWGPPTPPDDGPDYYVDHALNMLYDTRSFMTESQLPPVYVPPEQSKRINSDTSDNGKLRLPVYILKLIFLH